MFNSRFGWYAASNFGCQGDLGSIEVEFLSPKSTVAATRARIVVVSPTRVNTLVPTVGNTIRSPGLYSFERVSECAVSSHAVGVQAVYLNYDGRRVGIAGELLGLPVVTSVCPYTGTVGIEVIMRDGLKQSKTLSGVTQ